MKVKLYNLIQDAVEAGVSYGYNRAHKHTSTPAADEIKDQIEQAIMNELTKYLDFEDEWVE